MQNVSPKSCFFFTRLGGIICQKKKVIFILTVVKIKKYQYNNVFRIGDNIYNNPLETVHLEKNG
jgi:hypothetical protein